MPKADRPDVTDELLARVRPVMAGLPETYEEDAWVGVRWRIGKATIAHLFGGHDQLFRIVLKGQSADVAAFEHLGDPYFRAGWGSDVIGMLVDGDSDWEEIAELITESYCIQAPRHLVDRLDLPPQLG